MQQQPEFSREVVAVLIAAIIGSVIDPEDAFPAERPQPPRPSDEAAPDVQAMERRLSSLLRHFDFRFDQLDELGIPDSVRAEYGDVRWMILATMEYQIRLAGTTGSTH